ncbi:hypothetical protein AAA799E16_01038 [Marine Group I thaumarchaeote SCGC AAA799-E16]|uniref:Uncharacterized protein n=2 Tax=Marine Group I TaxID=905826 RepID=A0A087RS86_9ARCH|nr:hypothetical protein AAA799E16_01038 [Marine Group I thaumarchaeote SCGC AAA799-E16]KFM16340.1 hypothetical protein SCCGRSA3_02374 [Marine Group I thaumarchaeote SCGC RSA3]
MMRKVFTIFVKNKNMKNIFIVIPIIIAIIAIIVISITSFEKTNTIEIEDSINKELENKITPEIQEKLDEIEQNVEESKDLETNYDGTRERDWITSGPFEIDRSEYALGESIFIRINELGPTEKGQVAFLRPLNNTHYSVYLTIPFDGVKSSYNQYFTPDLSKAKGICSIEDIAGEWTVVFRGTDYDNLKFTISDEVIVPGEESRFESVC